jgi:hypothetical protein
VGGGIGVINIINRSAPAGVVKPCAECARCEARIINRDPIVTRQHVISRNGVLESAAAPVERAHLKPVGRRIGSRLRHRDFYWHEHCVRRRDQRRAIMGKSARIVQIDRRRPVDRVEVLRRGLIDGGVLRVAREHRNAGRRDRSLDCAALRGRNQTGHRQRADHPKKKKSPKRHP